MTSRRDCLQAASLGCAGLAFAGLAAPARVAGQAAEHAPSIGHTVHWPKVRLLSGRHVEPPSASHAAHVVVFFSTTCPFCVRHNAHVQALFEQSKELALRVLGVAQDRDESLVRTYLQRRGLSFDVSMDASLLRPALTRLKGIPITCVVDHRQRLREVIRGEMFEADVLGLIKWATA